MTKPSWFKWEITPGNVISWVVGIITIVMAFTALQFDVRELKAADERFNQRLLAIEKRSAEDHDALLEIRGDVRMIRLFQERSAR